MKKKSNQVHQDKLRQEAEQIISRVTTKFFDYFNG